MRDTQEALLFVLLLSAGLVGCGTRRITVPIMPPLMPIPKAAIPWEDAFETLDPQRWAEKEVHGYTDYDIVALDGRRCLKAHSHGGASILLTPVRFDPRTYPWLSWKWRVDRLVDGEALEHKRGSDAAARVYVYFESNGLPWQKRNLDYVWSSALPAGTLLTSAFSSESKIIVAQSGADGLGRWRIMERNLRDDYQRAFGDQPPDVIAIGIMSDTDNTGGEALAYFDDLQVSRAPLASSLEVAP